VLQPATIDILQRGATSSARGATPWSGIARLGFGAGHADRGFFVYADTSAAADSRAFSATCSATGVAITPGIDFGTHRASEHVRFADTIARAKLEDGIARLAHHLGKTLR
jgi:aspartate/methionine/tyrosine aminotransferase